MIAWLAELLIKWGLGWLTGFLPGYIDRRHLAEQTDRANVAEQTVATQTRVIENSEVRHEAEQQVAALPDAPAQRVADAVPGTAAAELRDEFSRDKAAGP